MIYPTRIGASICLMCCGLYLVSMQSQSGLMLLVLGLVFACLVMNLFAARRAARRLRLQPPAVIRCTEGERNRESWLVRNDAKTAGGFSEIFLHGQPFLKVGCLAPGEELLVAPETVFQRRGVYSFRKFRVRSSYPFGLINASTSLKMSGELLVRPAVYETRQPPAAGFEPVVGGSYSGRNRSSTGSVFHGIRPMQPQDPVKLIHWPSSAKGLGLLVREFEEELSGRTSILLDASAGSYTSDEHRLLLDAACRAAGSLGLAVLDAGNQLEFSCLNADPVQLSVPPFTDGGLLLDALARIEPAVSAPEPAAIESRLALLPRKSALSFIVLELNQVLLQTLARLAGERRKLAVFLPVNLPVELDQIPAGTNIYRYSGRDIFPEGGGGG